ncbi:MAG: arylamine N-acetyltransferase [Timaviella obliquedivisa GSE-PSE-MK23-08B]|jgi:N-hydroxyarylamine O-acetyltransferase|nr:arylamine N-acetyltransferase [Timaviella obliquedivisa GSE-PSE-MK23-08B]
MDISAYLQRIGYGGSIEPTVQTLGALQRAHLLTVPFENLDIHLGKPLNLDSDALFTKIVEQQRGGFCYELNGLLAEVLLQLGFEVSLLSAQVARKQGGFGENFDHLVLLVHLEEDWLVDVGFGESFPEPLSLSQEGACGGYRLSHDGQYWLVQALKTDHWQTQFRFTPDPHQFSEFHRMCVYHQTSPESKFTQRRLCSRATLEGRITLVDRRLILTRWGDRQERRLKTEQEYQQALADYFCIKIPEMSRIY